MFRVLFVFVLLISLCHGHMFVLGARGGVTPNDATVSFFTVNGIQPCGGASNAEAQYLNVTKSKCQV